MKVILLFLISLSVTFAAQAQSSLHSTIDKLALEINDEVIDWRRHFHENPELSNREFKTAETIATQLNKLGLKVDTGIALRVWSVYWTRANQVRQLDFGQT